MTVDDRAIAIAAGKEIDPDLVPPMHRSPARAARGGGRLEYATGDLIDPEICAGPFDVVIERRTVQLFAPNDQRSIEPARGARRADRLFIGHQHWGNWKPNQERRHFAERWLTQSDFAPANGSNMSDGTRVARAWLTTG